MNLNRFSILLLTLLLWLFPSSALSDIYPMNYRENGVALELSRVESRKASALRIDLQIPGADEAVVTEVLSPPRIVIDLSGNRITRNKELVTSDSPTVKTVRVSSYPNKVRLVVYLRGYHIGEYKLQQRGDMLYLFVAESGEISKLVEEELSTGSLADLPGKTESKLEIWNKSSASTNDSGVRNSSFTNRTQLEGEVKYSIEQQFQIAAGVRVNHFHANNLDDSSEAQAELANGYVMLADTAYNLKVGNQLVTWGKSDEVSPLDNINPEDFRDGFVRPHTERKRQTFITNLELYHDPLKLQALYIPQVRRSQINIFNDDWGPFGYLEPFEIEERLDDQNAYGARLAANVGTVDYAISFLDTMNPLPSLRGLQVPAGFDLNNADQSFAGLAQFAEATGQIIGLEYNRRQIYGAEFETTLDTFGVRGDFAYIKDEDFFTTDLNATRSPVIRYVLGIDYTSASDFYLNVQLGQSIIKDYEASFIATEGNAMLTYVEASYPLMGDDLTAGLRFSYDFTSLGGFYNPYLLLTFYDDINFEIGADIINGDPDTQLGVFNANDQVYLIIKGSI